MTPHADSFAAALLPLDRNLTGLPYPGPPGCHRLPAPAGVDRMVITNADAIIVSDIVAAAGAYDEVAWAHMRAWQQERYPGRPRLSLAG